jgi:peptide/nickel transport system substrate-binding protein
MFVNMDSLFGTDWTVNPSVQNYEMSYWDESYVTGDLLQDWEFSSPGTFVMHVRQGVYWQNLPPVNGREFNANDIVFHLDRMAGLGNGYTAPNAYFLTDAWISNIKTITATDNWTVVMTFSTNNAEFILENMEAPGCDSTIENPEAVQAYTNSSNPELSNWHNSIGTGPFIVNDFVDNSSATFIKNPNYWAFDERYPKNRLPYVNTVKVLIIPSAPTAEAAVRAGKIDLMDLVTPADATNMKQTNPEINEISCPLSSGGLTIDPRDDLSPYNNISVRKALQMAINLPEIAQDYFGGGCDPSPLPLDSNYMVGWGFPYSMWPSSLQAEYAFNPTQAKQLLAAAGYPNGFNTDIVVDSSNPYPDLVQIVQSEFASVGVNMSINVMAHSQFAAYVTTGHHEDALDYRSTGNLGIESYPIRALMKFMTGGASNDMMVSDPKIDSWYAQAINATSVDQIKQILQNENEYIVQQHFLISLVDPNLFFLSQPWLKGFSGQSGATCGAPGPLMGFEYWSRFWIEPH